MRKIISAFVLIVIISGVVYSQDVPANIQVQFILKILTMDKNINRYGSPIKIGVTSNSMLSAFNSASGITIAGKPFVANIISSVDDISNYTVIFVDTNWKSNYSAAGKIASANKVVI